MAFRPKAILPDYKSLRSTLVAAQRQIENYTLYQTIVRMLDNGDESQRVLRDQIEELETEIITITGDIQLHPFLFMGG